MNIKMLVIFALFIFPISAVAESDEKEQIALGVAQAWLALVDAGDHAASWDNASLLFQEAIDKQQWAIVAKDARQRHGDFIGRSVKSVTHTTSLPEAPAGEYVIVVYNSEFEEAETVTELVTPMLGEDGKWRVAGYYIQ